MAQLHSRFVTGILRFYSGATDVLDIDPAGYVDIKQATGLKINGVAVATVDTSGNLTMAKEVDHTISVTTSTTASTAGGALALSGGAGAATNAAGGAIS